MKSRNCIHRVPNRIFCSANFTLHSSAMDSRDSFFFLFFFKNDALHHHCHLFTTSEFCFLSFFKTMRVTLLHCRCFTRDTQLLRDSRANKFFFYFKTSTTIYIHHSLPPAAEPSSALSINKSGNRLATLASLGS